MTAVRPAAVAGMFYPDEVHALRDVLHRELDAASRRRTPGAAPKAIIAPHAGYVYSGPIAASAYAQLAAAADEVRRIVLIGPSHRMPLRGLAVPSVDAFETPLGRIELDRAAIADLLWLPQVREWDAPHAEEHSLEVHLPFLQTIFPRFTLVPIVVGEADAAEVAEVLDRVWGGAETRIVVSSDLSHYLDYMSAQRVDAATCQAIEALDGERIGRDQACGRVPVAGLLAVARRRGLRATTLDLRTSGDTAGDRRRVVGYGAWMFGEGSGLRNGDTPGDSAGLIARHGTTLLRLAAASILHGIHHNRSLPVNPSDYPAALREQAATFVTLKGAGQLRGCIGTIDAWRTLAEDVSANGFAAAFRDGRFPPLQESELPALELSVSVLAPQEELHFTDEADLLAQLRPGADGVIIRSDGQRAVFLPQVWQTLPEPAAFMAHLKTKAGLDHDHWSADFQAWRFAVDSISSATLAAGALWS